MAVRIDPGLDGSRTSTLIIDRPERANALDIDHCTELAEAVRDRIEAGDRSLVITGVAKSFCAGADFDEVGTDGFASAHRDLLEAVAGAPIPIVAAINGHAIGAGLQLALAADLRVGGVDSTFGLPTARLGVAVDPLTIARLVGATGSGFAKRLLLGCVRVEVADAHRAGLIDELGELPDALALAADMATMAPLTHIYNKLAVDSIVNASVVATAMAAGDLAAVFEAVWSSQDRFEGLAAKAEDRAPNFTGN